MRSPVTALIEQYKALTDVEQKVFLDLVDPQPEPEAPTKQVRKKRAARSPRSQSLSTAITSYRAAKAEGDLLAGADGVADSDEGPKCDICGNPRDYQDHFKPSPNYHEFEAPKVKKASGK